MANNRIYLICKRCKAEELQPQRLEKFGIMLAKCFVNGYYTKEHDDVGKRLDEFFDEHQSCGEHAFEIEYEVPE